MSAGLGCGPGGIAGPGDREQARRQVPDRYGGGPQRPHVRLRRGLSPWQPGSYLQCNGTAGPRRSQRVLPAAVRCVPGLQAHPGGVRHRAAAHSSSRPAGESSDVPEPVRRTRSVKLASEERVWKELVRDGVGEHFTNSFLVVGSTEHPARLWPDDRLAQYFSINRRREYVASTSVRSVGGGIQLDRTYSPEPGPLITDGVTSWAYVPGPSFLEVFFIADDIGRRELLQRWLDLVTSGDRRRGSAGRHPVERHRDRGRGAAADRQRVPRRGSDRARHRAGPVLVGRPPGPDDATRDVVARPHDRRAWPQVADLAEVTDGCIQPRQLPRPRSRVPGRGDHEPRRPQRGRGRGRHAAQDSRHPALAHPAGSASAPPVRRGGRGPGSAADHRGVPGEAGRRPASGPREEQGEGEASRSGAHQAEAVPHLPTRRFRPTRRAEGRPTGVDEVPAQPPVGVSPISGRFS